MNGRPLGMRGPVQVTSGAHPRVGWSRDLEGMSWSCHRRSSCCSSSCSSRASCARDRTSSAPHRAASAVGSSERFRTLRMQILEAIPGPGHRGFTSRRRHRADSDAPRPHRGRRGGRLRPRGLPGPNDVRVDSSCPSRRHPPLQHRVVSRLWPAHRREARRRTRPACRPARSAGQVRRGPCPARRRPSSATGWPPRPTASGLSPSAPRRTMPLTAVPTSPARHRRRRTLGSWSSTR
jgi:hypothetical protein